jgi:hypothetical protein
MERWSAQHAWVARVTAWDAHVTGATEEAFLDAARQMARRQAADALALQEQALAKLRALDPQTLTPRDAARLWETAVTVERLARGVATAHVRNELDARVDARVETDYATALQRPEVRKAAADWLGALTGVRPIDPGRDDD